MKWAGVASALCVLFVGVTSAQARSFRVNDVPNGDSFNCALCHGGYPPTTNPFGVDAWETFSPNLVANASARVDWSTLAAQDSDSDGLTNGEELGDPMGVWTRGSSNPPGPITNPGVYTPNCGNGIADTLEECDFNDLKSQTCSSQGFLGGTLQCDPTSCTLDLSLCDSPCGNGLLDANESCDGPKLNGQSCASQGFASGTLSCQSTCDGFDTSQCMANPSDVCGNGVRQGSEECDGTDLGPNRCEMFGFDGGNLACIPGSCLLDVSGCELCGDDVQQGSEVCDGTDLAGNSCQSLGYASGTLACAGCLFDESSCSQCGNGMVEGGEACDGADLNGQTCEALGFLGGPLSCTARCAGFDTSQCFMPLPDMGMLDMSTPDMSMPDMSMPDMRQVDMATLPDMRAADMSMPDMMRQDMALSPDMRQDVADMSATPGEDMLMPARDMSGADMARAADMAGMEEDDVLEGGSCACASAAGGTRDASPWLLGVLMMGLGWRRRRRGSR